MIFNVWGRFELLMPVGTRSERVLERILARTRSERDLERVLEQKIKKSKL